ncbi:lipase family protein [Pseudomonas sp. 148P]|uniref:Lipase family protein n=1 Tax=Pseudomonas ulcerans TaxID=3115852 RepID=A0ABU7HUI9_9PSED|nr:MULTISPECIES: lipase family protein [unclassified Pseudomonas]MEE1924022.1 lipase family protein [Pseudomonas sp. 147P]MEE1935215.1 lipase family protein [Pseudomonas sp. 148P]
MPITALQVAAEQTPTGPLKNGLTYLAQQRAEQENAEFWRVEVRDFAPIDAVAHLPTPDKTRKPYPSIFLKQAVLPSPDQPGVALGPNTHNVLEVKALRAYSPLLSHDKAFCALNAYHLSVMCMLSYAPFNLKREDHPIPKNPPYEKPGCIGRVLQEQLARCERPTYFGEAGPYQLLLEEVPYSKRLEVVPYDPDRYKTEARAGWEYPESVHFLHDDGDNQAFITHNDRMVLISVRGTAGPLDALRDMDARQVSYAPDPEGKSEAHRGFYRAFEAVQKFVDIYLRAFYTGNQTLMVCGHSLGGAIALLLAEWLRRKPGQPKVILYTIGAPRAGNQSFVKAASDLTHYRIVNHNDPVPGVPSTWMDAEWRLALPGTAMLIAAVGSPWLGIVLTLGGLINLKDDDYEHHGDQWHLIPRNPEAKNKRALLWQPGCAAISEKACAEYAAQLELEGDMPRRDGLARQLFHLGDHSSDGGYSRGLLTTLLRWYASVRHRDGQLFTADERKQLLKQLAPLKSELENPIPLRFEDFRKNLSRRSYRRFSQASNTELRSIFHSGAQQLESLRQREARDLTRSQKRLKAQAERILTWQDVFGELPQSPALLEQIEAWLDQPATRKAAEIAKVFERIDDTGLYA